MTIKHLCLLLLSMISFSCTDPVQSTNTGEKIDKARQIVDLDFNNIIDSAKVVGSILIYDAQSDIYYSNDFQWAKEGQLPASTFKVPHSMIALDIGVVGNDSTLLKWDGEKRAFKVWEQDLTFHDAFHYSCVPCYQEIARKIGAKKMSTYLQQFNYGSMVVDTSNIDNFWLKGDARINQFQQINFLRRFYESKLSISPRTTAIMKRLMVIKKSGDYQLSGKTGWSTQNGIDNGWYIGYIEKRKQLYYFATNIEPKPDFEMKNFAKIRKEITHAALRKLKMNE